MESLWYASKPVKGCYGDGEIQTWKFYLLGWAELLINPYIAFGMTPENLYHLKLGTDKQALLNTWACLVGDELSSSVTGFGAGRKHFHHKAR